MQLAIGAKVKFAEERLSYTVQAVDARFAVCTKPFNPRRTVLYTVIDFEEGIRGTENLVFGAGAETRTQCEEMLDRLSGRDPYLSPFKTEVSHRNRIQLNIDSIKPAQNEVKS